MSIMNDQASALRQIVQNIKNQRSRLPDEGARVVCVTSGKGGVGKTNFAVNLAISLSKKGLRTLIIDSDFGLANVDVVMGVNPEFDLSHVVNFKKEIKDVIFDGPNGVRIVSGGSGVFELLTLPETRLASIVDNLLALEDLADVIIFDTGAGVNANVLKLISSSQETIVVTTPEPTAIMDAYALIKTVLQDQQDVRMRLVVNKAENIIEAEDALSKFSAVVRLYLQAEMEPLGYILSDSSVSKAVRLQRPFVLSFPKSVAAKNMETITWKFMNLDAVPDKQGLRGFLDRFIGRK